MRAEMRAQERAARRRRNAFVGTMLAFVLLVGGLVFWWPMDDEGSQRSVASSVAPTTLGEDWSRGEPLADWRTAGADESSATEGTSTTTSLPTTTTGAPEPTVPASSTTSAPTTPAESTTSTTKANGPPSKPPNTNRPTKTPRPNAEGVQADCSVELFGICL